MTRILTRTAIAAMAWLVASSVAPAQITEGFDNVPGLTGSGWFFQNNSTPLGTNPVQPFQGNTAVFVAQAGPDNSYAAYNFNAVAGNNTISVWMLTPEIPLDNGSIVSFFTRTIDAPAFPDRLQIRFSTAGASTNVGTLANDVGDFTNLLLDINAGQTVNGFPTSWTNFSPSISGLGGPTTGRIAFRYFVTGGGPSGANSDFIGVDTLSVTPVPEPTSLVLGGMAVGGLIWRKRRAARS